MKDATFFTRPVANWQRRYEALRSSLVERLPDQIVAERFGFSTGYLRVLRHQFRHGKIDFSEPPVDGENHRRKVTPEMRRKIVSWRHDNLSAGEIAQLFSEEATDISIRTIERVLAEEGFPKLPRRTQLKIGRTVKGAEVPQRSEPVLLSQLNGQRFESAGAGVFLFAPLVVQLHLDEVVQAANLPKTKNMSALNYFLSFLALKLLGAERYAHVGDHAFDPGLGLFAGLNVLPKCTALSTYSYSLDNAHLIRLQEAFIKHVLRLGLCNGDIVNLDFHTIPHHGDESVLEEHWAGARGKRMKGALTLLAQDAESKLILYSAADIQRNEADDQVLSFLAFWKKMKQSAQSTFIFDSKLTTYENLSELNQKKIKFITLRRRGHKLVEDVALLTPWRRINIPHDKRKYPQPLIHESRVELRGYEGELRQIVLRGNGREKPSFLITNDFDGPAELIVGNYARRWRVENGIAEAVKFFHLNSLSSPILIKVHFDIVMTMIADTLYSRLAQNLRGFEACDAPKIYRHFIKGKGVVEVRDGRISVTFPKHAHNPILRSVAWQNLPQELPWIDGAKLSLQFN
ncbi:MAG TPA: transposase [Desulfobacteraceae bacterium]|nr:transposase [Desulfobacteraceae bacterium]